MHLKLIVIRYIELLCLDIVYPDFEDKSPEVIREPLPLNLSPYTVLSTEDELQSLIVLLKQVNMIGFDILNIHTAVILVSYVLFLYIPSLILIGRFQRMTVITSLMLFLFTMSYGN